MYQNIEYYMTCSMEGSTEWRTDINSDISTNI